MIASAKVEEVAKQADNYVTVDGQFHIAKSYGPATYAEADRSRVYAGIKLMDPASPVTYEDAVYDLLRHQQIQVVALVYKIPLPYNVTVLNIFQNFVQTMKQAR